MNEYSGVEELITEAAVVVRDVGRELLTEQKKIGKLLGTEEGGREVKLMADERANSLILESLKKTGLGILSEESGWIEATVKSPLKWVVDPLDGSFNYLRGISYCAVSVGLCEGDRPVAGVIYDLNEKKLITGIVGKGAYAEGTLLSASAVTDPAQAALTTGFPARMNYDAENLARFISQIRSFQKIRMLGSAVQSCLHIAKGQIDAYYEQDTMLWDIAAGCAIIEAAGGHYEMEQGSREHARNIWACAPGLKTCNPRKTLLAKQ